MSQTTNVNDKVTDVTELVKEERKKPLTVEGVRGMNGGMRRRNGSMLAPWVLGGLLVFSLGTVEGAVQVRMTGERLTVRAMNTPFRDVLQAVATAGQFSLQLDAPFSDPVTIQIEQQPLLDGLELLLRDQSSLIQYTREGGQVRVLEVIVLAQSPSPERARAAGLGVAADPGALPVSAVEILTKLATSAEAVPAERIGAALALAEGGDTTTGREVIADLLHRHEEPDVRQEALVALTGLAAMPLAPVEAAAMYDPEPSVRSLALALLSEVAKTDPRAAETLGQAALQDADAGTRQMAQALLEASRDGNP